MKKNGYVNMLLFVEMMVIAIPVSAQKSREGFACGGSLWFRKRADFRREIFSGC